MSITTELLNICLASNGGVLEIYLANKDDINTFTLSGDVYSAVVMEAGKVFYKFEFEQDTAEWREVTTRNDNGSTSVVDDVEFQVTKMSAVTRKSMQEIIDCGPCGNIAIIKDGNAEFWVIGYGEKAVKERPLKINTETSGTGKAFTDTNASIPILTSMSGEKARNWTGGTPPV